MIAAFFGGASSGKSEAAERLVLKTAKKPPVYLATMINSSPEDGKIVERHTRLRRGKGFITVEKSVRLYEASLPDCDTILLEDIPNLTANEFFSYGRAVSGAYAYGQMVKGLDFLADNAENLIIVTGNVFEDGITYDPSTEEYLKTFGDVNIYIAQRCDIFAEMINGLPLFYKGAAEL